MQEPPQAPGDFQWTILGGPWTFEATGGQQYDYFVGKACGKGPEFFCQSYGLARSSRFPKTLYGDELAATLSRFWCHKMQYDYDIYRANGSMSDALSAADHAGYQEPPEVTGRVRSLSGPQAARVKQLRSFRPRSSSASTQ